MPDRRPPILQNGDIVLDRYHVTGTLATGGHSVIYVGEDERLHRAVCVKVFDLSTEDEGVARTTLEHFVQEAFALSKLTHPNTLRIYDFGHVKNAADIDCPVQISEFMNGGNLSQRLRQHGAMPLDETLDVLRSLASALDEAHGVGLIHRDIKPQNILFADIGELRLPKLADFGIAKWTPGSASAMGLADDTQIVAGRRLTMYSPSWAAPEQFTGHAVDASTDLYSLALLGVFMLTGQAMFADDDVYAGYEKRKQAALEVERSLAPQVMPAPLIQLLCDALAFNQQDRPPSAKAFIQRLDDCQAVPEFVPPPPRRRQTTANEAALPPQANHSMRTTGAPFLAIDSYGTQHVGNRAFEFWAWPHASTDIAPTPMVRLRVGGLADQAGMHLRGLHCFLRPAKTGRPTLAMQVWQTTALACIKASGDVVAQLTAIPSGSLEQGRWVFRLGDMDVGLPGNGPSPMCLDFGPCAICYFFVNRDTI